jgi:L-fuculose-phosphate aldolase
MRTNRYLHPRDEIVQTMARIYGYQLTTTSGGNLSLRDGDGNTWITPAALDKGDLRREQIVQVRPDDSVEGSIRPSSELPFHRAIYQARPDLGAIVHAHPVNLVAFSLVHQAPDTRLLPPVFRVCGEVGFAPYALPGSEQLGANIAQAFARGFSCVILENHGVVTGGKDLRQAFQRFEALEALARMIIKAKPIGPLHSLGQEQVEALLKPGTPLSQREPAGLSTEERELRGQLCRFVQRGYQQRLLVSALGSFSARVGDDAFLITPHEQDRLTLEPEDFVLVANGSAEAGKLPSTVAALHHAMYRRRPDVKAIITACPEHATAFGLCRRPLEIRTIPESYVVLRRVAQVSVETQLAGVDKVAECVSAQQPVAILENNGVIVTGSSVLSAYDRLEVLEYTAQSLIHAQPLGKAIAISEPMVRQLEAAFLYSK